MTEHAGSGDPPRAQKNGPPPASGQSLSDAELLDAYSRAVTAVVDTVAPVGVVLVRGREKRRLEVVPTEAPLVGRG